MRTINTFFVIGIFIVAIGTAHGQQTATYAQYMFNGLAINPAYAGSNEALVATFLGRVQNVGLPGAPNTQTFSAHTPLLDKRMGLGALIIKDNLSIINQTGLHFSYAYRLPLKRDEAYLSFGLQGGATFYNAEYSQLDLFNNPSTGSSDPLFANDIRRARPNIGAGMYYNSRRSYLGVSMPSMVNNVFDRGEDLTTVVQTKPVIVNGGHVFTLSRVLKLKPNFLFLLIDGKFADFDLNMSVLFDEVLWVGSSFKSSNQIVAFTQMKVNDQLQVGYSYTVTNGPIRVVELGSHEFMATYRFLYNKRGVISPRYF